MRSRIVASSAVIALCAMAPAFAQAQSIDGIAFTSEVQSVALGSVSSQLTIQAQSGGQSASLPQTGCIELKSTSSSGQFSSSATNWNPASVLTMNKSTANKNFYYQDQTAGTFTITARLVLKPETEARSCASWPTSEWGSGWTATQSISIGDPAPQVPEQPQEAAPSQKSAPVSSYVPPPVPQLFADGGEDRVVIVGADTEFRGRAYDRSREYVDHTRFSWNFGDGSTAEGQAVLHHFAYPGRYVVVLSVASGLDPASDRFVVTAEPARLAFAVFADGSAAVENEAGRDLDLSGWIVRNFGREFFLPAGTIVIAGTSLRVPHTTLGFWSGKDTELAYPNGVLALRAGERAGSPAVATSSEASPRPALARAVPAAPSSELVPDRAAPEEDTAPAAQVASAAQATERFSWWWIGALAVSLFGAGAVAVSTRLKRGEWDIAEL